MIDLHPAATRMAALVQGAADDQLTAPTPCPDASLGDLIDHIGNFAQAFAAAARKEIGPVTGPPPPPSGDNLEDGWRERISLDLLALAEAWREPDAWVGLTTAGGIELPAEVVGLVALDELVVHGWDIAVASAQPYSPEPQDVQGATIFVTSFEAPRDGTLFGPVVDVADDASPFERLLGLTGRDPAWRPPGG